MHSIDPHFEQSARLIAKYLACNGSRDAAAVEKLIGLGKIIIAPTPQSVGLDATSQNWVIAQERNGSDLKAYVFTEKLNERDLVRTMVSEILPIVAPEMMHTPWWRRILSRG